MGKLDMEEMHVHVRHCVEGVHLMVWRKSGMIFFC